MHTQEECRAGTSTEEPHRPRSFRHHAVAKGEPWRARGPVTGTVSL